MSSMVLHKYYHIHISIMQSTRPAWYWWCQLGIDGTKILSTGFIDFSNHDTSNIPNLLNPTVNSSLASQTKCDNMFSDSESDPGLLFFFSYVVIIHLLWRGGGVVIYCPLITYWIESTWAHILFSFQIQNGDTEPKSKYYLEEYFNIAYSKHSQFI